MRLLLMAFLLTLLTATWWALRPSSETKRKTAGEDHMDYYATGVDLSVFSAKGERVRHLQAQRLEHMEKSNRGFLFQPHLELFEKDKKTWEMRALHATVEQNGKLLLLENRVWGWHAATRRHPAATLTTERLKVKPDEKYAETDLPVTINSKNNWIHSVGMKAWLKEPGKVHFLSRTRAHYEVE